MKFCSYRSKAYMFEEFLSSWYEKLKSEEPTTMTVRLQKDIDKYKVHVTQLNFCLHNFTYKNQTIEKSNLTNEKIEMAICTLKSTTEL